MYSSIIKRHCKCKDNCPYMPSIGFQGFYYSHAPQEIKDAQGKKAKKSYQQSAARARKGVLSRKVTKYAGENDAAKSPEKPLSGISSLIQDLDWTVSRYIRIKFADKNGMVQCYTCPAIFHWSLIHCGHFIDRTHLATRWLVENLRPQCIACNSYHKGNIEIYAERLESENNGITEYLQEQARIVTKPTQNELKELLSDFRSKLKLVETKLKPLNENKNDKEN